ncbi:MAG: nitrilase-related carbon-nitrogen hydrolase [Candidatus Aminicenantes bacterium]
MKVALAQIAPRLGDIKQNLRRHLDIITEAKKKKTDLLVFPELSLTGYTLKDLTQEIALDPHKDDVFQILKKQSLELALIFGFAEESEDGLIYNSSAFLAKGKTLHIHRKIFLPTYGMFEEGKFFARGKNFRTFFTPFGKMGMMICYDFLHYGASYLLFVGGSGIITVISSAPGRGMTEGQTYATSHMWELMGETISRFSSAFVIYCNRVGTEDGKLFAGGSFIYNPAGQLITKASYVDEELIVADIDLDEIRALRKKWPYKRDEKPEIILEALKRIVRDYED